MGFLAQYALVLIPTAASGPTASGVLVGSAFAFGFLLFAGWCTRVSPGPFSTHLALGALVALIPAAYTGSSTLILQELSAAKLAYGEGGRGLDPSEGLKPTVTEADVFALRGLKPSNFRFDLMGEAHESLPLNDPKGLKKAGKSEEGTYCAVPVVHDTWTIAEAIPFWYICENDWGGHVSCKDSYKGNYDTKDYYGWSMLSECLQKPEKLLKDSGGVGVMYFFRLDFVSNFNEFAQLARTAIVQASIDNKLMLRFEAPRVRLPKSQEKCCGPQIAEASANMTNLSFGALVFIAIRAVLVSFRIFFPEKAKDDAAFLTRKELKRIKLKW